MTLSKMAYSDNPEVASSYLWSSSSGFDASAVYVVVFIFYSGTL